MTTTTKFVLGLLVAILCVVLVATTCITLNDGVASACRGNALSTFEVDLTGADSTPVSNVMELGDNQRATTAIENKTIESTESNNLVWVFVALVLSAVVATVVLAVVLVARTNNKHNQR